MAMRRQMTRKESGSHFTRHAGHHPKNNPSGWARGGIRL
ncbi:MAG: hypothetical protein [Microvirus sp.]|nr:MAG: hypothetical protein [Microvirus sp.]